VDVSGEGVGFFRSLALGFVGLDRHLGYGTPRVRPPDMNKEANQHESNHEKLIKQQV
jgi:hypothetical protein